MKNYYKSQLNKKSICHVEITTIDYMPRVWRSAEAAKENGYDVTVIGFGEDTKYNSITFRGLKAAKNRFDRVLHTSKQMVKMAAASNAYIVELHSPELLLYISLLRRAEKKIIFNSHEFYYFQLQRREYIPKAFRSIVSRMYQIWEKRICRKIDYVLYPCTINGKNPFVSYGCKSAKIENYSADIAIPICSREPRTAIYAGSLSEDRGCTTMVDAFNYIDGKLYLAGAFSSEEFQKFILRRADQTKVKYLGALSREQLFSYYSRVSVGLSLLKKEGQYNEIDNLSTKMYEYMSCGIPVVATNMDYAKTINEECQYGILVDPNNMSEIVKAISTVFSDEELARRLGENGKRVVKERFNWNEEKKLLMSIYEDMTR